ncbi:hypothetical protein [Enterococcus faecium]|uniref:Uncharacterized protein n=1 Tax=Enterococcus faecium TaxID=1352 RepID=A0A6A8NHV3_ENTFC|nr:hypothetical protein [Enterococcus faecium]MBD9707693.1 hypothetical protein [Enterococcus faecium]MTD23335.1 hypothetical protein [Enterococcus faecium]MTD35041.1 hypothetical protein [Enterococcus faecium]
METITLTTEELSQRIAKEVEKQLAEQKKPKINYGLKFSKEVEAWLEKQGDDRKIILNQKGAIYEAVKACLNINRMSELTEENYHLAVNVFDQQKIFFKKRVFPLEQEA